MSLCDCKSAHDKNNCKIKNMNTAYDMQSLLFEYFSADHYEMPNLLSICQIHVI
jgi:hypothetical protein